MDFVANFIENTTVKKMKIGQGYERMYSGAVFLTHCAVMPNYVP